MEGWSLTDEFIGNTLYGDVDGVPVRFEPPAHPQLAWTRNGQPVDLPAVLEQVPPMYRQWVYDFTNATVVAFARQARDELALVQRGHMAEVHEALALLQAAARLHEQAQDAREAYSLIAPAR